MSAAPTYGASGELIDGGADLGQPGFTGFYFDAVYISIGVQLGAMFSDWFWLLYLSVRIGPFVHAPWHASVPGVTLRIFGFILHRPRRTACISYGAQSSSPGCLPHGRSRCDAAICSQTDVSAAAEAMMSDWMTTWLPAGPARDRGGAEEARKDREASREAANAMTDCIGSR